MYKDKIIELCIFHIDEKDNRIENLQAVNDTYQGEIFKLEAENKRLQAELDKAENGRQVMYNEMDAEVKELQVENIKLSSECWCGGNNDVKAELNALREQELDLIRDKDELKAELDKEKEFAIETSIKNDRLMTQVNSKWTNNSNVHTISGEIAEYMDHNPKCKGARLFLLPIEVFDSCGDWDGSLYWDNGIE